MSRGLLIIGTDTEVGKTVLSAALVAALRARGLDAGYLKPLGTEGRAVDGTLVNPDALWVARVAGLDDDPRLLNPFCLREPLSPLAAARVEGGGPAWDQVLKRSRSLLGRRDFVVVEGVGGLLVPICDGRSFLDLAAGLGLPVLVAARGGLGTINHTLLTIEALRGRDVALAGFAFCGPEPAQSPDAARNSTLTTEFSGARFLGALPWLEGLDGDGPGPRLARAAEEHLDLGPILELAQS